MLKIFIPTGTIKPKRKSKAIINNIPIEIIQQIRYIYGTEKLSYVQLSLRFNLDRSIISKIIKRQIYNEIEDLDISNKLIKINNKKEIRLTQTQIENIILDFKNENISVTELSKRYNVYPTKISNLLNKYALNIIKEKAKENILPDNIIQKIKYDYSTLPDSYYDLSIKYNLPKNTIKKL